MTEPHHNNEGNCWAPEACYGCDKCGDALCDVCHEHDEPRGDCSGCKRCATCDEEDTRTP